MNENKEATKLQSHNKLNLPDYTISADKAVDTDLIKKLLLDNFITLYFLLYTLN